MSPTRVLRFVILVALVSVTSLTTAGAVAAKDPQFTLDVTPSHPIAGHPVSVVLRLSDYSPPITNATELVAFIPDGGTRSQHVPVPLVRSADGSYRADVFLPAGVWTLLPFPKHPLGEAVPGYPQPISMTVAPAPPSAPHTARQAAPMPFDPTILMLAAVALAVLLLLRRILMTTGRVRIRAER
jgi:hypothetical protein